MCFSPNKKTQRNPTLAFVETVLQYGLQPIQRHWNAHAVEIGTEFNTPIGDVPRGRTRRQIWENAKFLKLSILYYNDKKINWRNRLFPISPITAWLRQRFIFLLTSYAAAQIRWNPNVTGNIPWCTRPLFRFFYHFFRGKKTVVSETGSSSLARSPVIL